jgi:hypothetical protein
MSETSGMKHVVGSGLRKAKNSEVPLRACK